MPYHVLAGLILRNLQWHSSSPGDSRRGLEGATVETSRELGADKQASVLAWHGVRRPTTGQTMHTAA